MGCNAPPACACRGVVVGLLRPAGRCVCAHGGGAVANGRTARLGCGTGSAHQPSARACPRCPLWQLVAREKRFIGGAAVGLAFIDVIDVFNTYMSTWYR